MARRTQTYAIRLAVEGGGQVKAELVSVGQSGEQSLKRIESAGNRASGGLKGLGRQAELLRTGIRTLGGALTVDFTDASKAYFFPVGVPGLFRQYNAPADFVETANTIGLPRYAKQAVDQQSARWGHAARAVEPAADLHAAAGADQGQAHLMTVFENAVDATFAAFGIDAVYTPAGGDPVPVRVIARRPIPSSAWARRASTPRPQRSSCRRARSPTCGPAIS